MARAKTGKNRRRRHKKILKLAKGFSGTNRRLYKRANEAVLHSGHYAYVGRKLRKRDFRKLWIMRINAAVRKYGTNLTYSKFIHALDEANIKINRKMLAHLAVNDKKAFREVLKVAQKAI